MDVHSENPDKPRVSGDGRSTGPLLRFQSQKFFEPRPQREVSVWSWRYLQRHLHDLENLLLGREWHPKVLVRLMIGTRPIAIVQDYWLIVAKQQSEHHFIGQQTFWMLKAAVHLKSCHVGKIVYPIFPMVLLIIIPTKWLFHWGYTPFSDIPMFAFRFLKISQHFTSQWPK